MKTAIIHDWLVTYGGAERVLEQILFLYPEADLYSLIDFVPGEQRSFLGGRRVNTSFIQKLPLACRRYRYYLPLMPLAIEQFDLSAYDLVISSSHTVAKGVLTGPDQVHICLCYTPVRYAWDLQHQYLQEAGIEKGIRSWYIRHILHKLRLWDYRTAAGVDSFIAISEHIARRIWKVYRRESTVIYPPVDLDRFTPGEKKENFYLTVSRLVPYKKISLLVEAFSQMPDKKLVVIGDGPDLKKIKGKSGPNVEILGYRSHKEVVSYMQKAQAFIFTALEDFGIVLLEAQASGTPVIAFGRGGALETVRGPESMAPTGIFFREQSTTSIISAVREFDQEKAELTAENCRQNSLQFSIDIFRDRLKNHITEIILKNQHASVAGPINRTK